MRPSMRPYRNGNENGISSSAAMCRKSVNGVPDSNGCAEFALKKPPPLVPSCLIASWLAAGPRVIVCAAPSSVVTCAGPSNVMTTPRATSTTAITNESGIRMYSVPRTRSAQKLPMPLLVRAGEPADERHRDGHAGRGRDEVLHGKAGGLRQVAHGRLGDVGLPVRVRHEADRRVHRDVGAHALQRDRVERQVALDPLDQVQHEEARGGEHEQRARVLRARSCRARHRCAARGRSRARPARRRREPGAPALVDPVHVAGEQVRAAEHDEREEDEEAERYARLRTSPGGASRPGSRRTAARRRRGRSPARCSQPIDPHCHQADEPEQDEDESDVDDVHGRAIEPPPSPGVKCAGRDLKAT